MGDTIPATGSVLCPIFVDRGLGLEFEAEAGCGGHRQEAVDRLGYRFPQMEEARHVLSLDQAEAALDAIEPVAEAIDAK